MKQEDKQLLLKDISARLPYGVVILVNDTFPYTVLPYTNAEFCISNFSDLFNLKNKRNCGILQKIIKERPEYIEIKPYLRPLSSMTEEELYIIESNWAQLKDGNWLYECVDEITTLLNSHHFDYNGLIEKGLAIEAPEGMYNGN